MDKEKNKYKKELASLKKNWKNFVNDGKNCIKEFKNKETRYKQIPNAFTASRLLAPFFIIPAAVSGNIILTGIFAAGFAITDACDGYFARKYNVMSEFGRELDPITDKLFAGSLLIPLVFINPVLIATLALEFIIACINMHSRLNNNRPKTAIVGKVKTGALSITMIICYISLALRISPDIINLLIGLTSGLQIATALKYYQNYKIEEEKKVLANIDDDKKKNDNTESKLEKKTNEKKLEKENNSLIDISINQTENKIDELKKLKEELVKEPQIEKPKVYKK